MNNDLSTQLEDLALKPKNQLRGSDNYKDWLRIVTSRLINKDVYEVASGTDTYPSSPIET
jgi:hypothetical protein